MSPRESLPVAAAVLVALNLHMASEAAILTYVTQGRVTQITDPLGLLNFVHLNDTVTYQTTFDAATPDLDPLPTNGGYSGLSSSLRIGQVEFTGSSPGMGIQHPLDLVTITSTIDVSRPGLTATGLVLFTLNDQVRSQALQDTALPLTSYDLSLFGSSYHKVTFYAPPQAPGGYQTALWFGGAFDSFVVTPEPTALVFAAAGGLVLIRKRCRALTGESAPRLRSASSSTHQKVRL